MSALRLFSAAALILCASPALAGFDIHVPGFSGIDAHSGASVVVRHGPVQRVTVIEGDMKFSKIEVKGNSLDVEGCAGNWLSWMRCPSHYTLRVEVVTPNVNALEAHGGGNIRADGSFPQQQHLSLQAHGGGEISVRAIPAEHVDAQAHGGGDIHLTALISLKAEAHGGGAIRYAGNPKQVQASSFGGGAISHE